MNRDTKNVLNQLINNICSMEEVQSIGISGSINPLPKAGEGDIDIFIYCGTIPEPEKRLGIINQMESLTKDGKVNAFEGGHWGIGDFLRINGVETWLMYFTTDETLCNIDAICNGKYPDKLDNYYYPVGRLAMLERMNIMYDKNDFLISIQKRLKLYPQNLALLLTQHHLEELEDVEDLERAVFRKDVLFYHFALDMALDHFLQALFAINKRYFPSRKRTLDFLECFDIKPKDVEKRLLDIVRLGGSGDTINQSYSLWCELVSELKECTCKDERQV